MAAYGLYSHIQSNRRRSAALLIALFFLVYVLVYAGALTAEALSIDADLDTLMQRAWNDLVSAAPLATAAAPSSPSISSSVSTAWRWPRASSLRAASASIRRRSSRWRRLRRLIRR